jgi:hypothetical protein
VFNDDPDLFRGFVVYADLFTTSEEVFAGSVPIEVLGRVATGLAVMGYFKGVDLPFLVPSGVALGSLGVDLSVDLVKLTSGLAGVEFLAGSGFPTPRKPSAVFEFDRPVVP